MTSNYIPKYLTRHENEFEDLNFFMKDENFSPDDLFTTTKGALILRDKVVYYRAAHKYRRIFRLAPQVVKDFVKKFLYENPVLEPKE